jgi:response regulator RpfG family c-di-GMP phosphodiesterase
MNRKVLLVDDEPRVLDGYRRNLRKQFDIATADGGHAGLVEIETSGPYAVVVSDYRLPEMNGVDFLSQVAEVSPQTIRMMLTGQADMDATIASINDGRVFRFLTKPCPPESLAAALDEAVEHYRLVEAEKELLEQTLRQTVGVLIDVLGLIDPATHHHSVRISDRVEAISETLGLDGAWEYSLSATLSQLGMIALPASIVEKCRRGEQLRPADQELMESHPESAHNLLERIPRLERVAKIVLMPA